MSVVGPGTSVTTITGKTFTMPAATWGVVQNQNGVDVVVLVTHDQIFATAIDNGVKVQ